MAGTLGSYDDKREMMMGDRRLLRWLYWLGIYCLWVGIGQAEGRSFRLGGYLPEYRAQVVSPEAIAFLTDLTVFSIELNPDGTLLEKRWTNQHWQAIQPLRVHPSLRTHVCIGGWDRSAAFSEVCRTVEARHRVCQELVTYCRKHSLSGVNLDWEHPSTAEEQLGLSTLLQELKSVLNQQALELSIAVAPSQRLPAPAWEAVDHILLMSYDDAGRHSTFESTQKHVAMLLDQKIPASKIILCLPLYGRRLENREAKTYATIIEKYAPRSDQDEVDGIYFNGPGTIAAKTAWAQTIGLGGVTVWELGQDAPGEASLIQVIRANINFPELIKK